MGYYYIDKQQEKFSRLIYNKGGIKKKMADKLIIVESPAKAATIKKFLGGNVKVLASMGHIRDLPKSKLAIDIENDFTQNI